MVHADRGSLALHGSQLRWGARTYVMGIVNVTPDSFSGDGVEDSASAVTHALAQWQSGADLLDIGGESTRPGHRPVTEELERARAIPVIAAVAGRLPHVPISIDSYKPAVVRAARAAGAEIVNSVWGAPDELLEIVAELGMAMVVMHNQIGTAYEGNVMDSVVRYLDGCAKRALARGIPAERLVLDPGIGFGKTADQNIEVLRRLPRLPPLGFPTMLGASRKSTIGKLVGKEPSDRVYGTVVTTALAVQAGIDIVRVHDVAAARDSVAVADAIVRDWRPSGWIG